jgi:hypothetical protein
MPRAELRAAVEGLGMHAFVADQIFILVYIAPGGKVIYAPFRCDSLQKIYRVG